jgi:hypothetical protein
MGIDKEAKFAPLYRFDAKGNYSFQIFRRSFKAANPNQFEKIL